VLDDSATDQAVVFPLRPFGVPYPWECAFGIVSSAFPAVCSGRACGGDEVLVAKEMGYGLKPVACRGDTAVAIGGGGRGIGC
jgi:hypothetical protein